MKFRTVIKLSGKTATGIEVPPEVVPALGSGKRPAVSVRINGYTYRSTVAPMGGVFMLPVSAEVRECAGVAAGDKVDVELESDTAPREVIVPADLARALEGDANAKRFFEGLSYSKQQRVVLPLEGAKTAETRAKRLEKVIGIMHEGRI
jgi:Domain of unknown function (DUF1905)/Bacteriocin-protection, YdeI or OmpD-Associated